MIVPVDIVYTCEPAVVFLHVCALPLVPITHHYSVVCFVSARPVITSLHRNLYTHCIQAIQELTLPAYLLCGFSIKFDTLQTN